MPHKPQNYANHFRFYPIYHYFAFPILGINVIVAAVVLFREPGAWAVWQLVVAIALAAAVFASRIMALTAQDRLIRLEERQRLKRVLPEDMASSIGELSVGQLISLRFAPDDEVTDLARRCLAGELQKRSEIKKQIKNWKADHLRV